MIRALRNLIDIARAGWSQPTKQTPTSGPQTSRRKNLISTTSVPGKYTALGYRAAEVLRRSSNALPEQGSADFHTRDDRVLLIDQARQFSRDNGFYKGVKNRAIDNIIGSGFTPQAQTGDEALNANLESLWKTFTTSPEVRELFNWQRLERLCLAELIDTGDFLALKSASRLQMIKAERIAGPTEAGTEQGVKLDSVGKPIGFYVANNDSSGQVDCANAKLYSPEQVIYAASLEEWDQTRGMPAQVQNFPMFHRINDIADSEAQAWQILARFAVAINKTGASAHVEAAEEDSEKSSYSLADRIQDVGAATIFYGEPGESITGVDRSLPGANFVEALTMFIRCLGLPLGLPLELILLDWSKTNYSQARAALEQAYRNFKCWQSLLISQFHSKVYLWKIDEWTATGLIPQTQSIQNHKWICPEFPWLDQLKETEAWEKRISSGLSTHSEALASLNRDRREFLEEREREIEEAIIIAERLNAGHPSANVDWRPLAGVQSSKTANQPAPSESAPKATEE